MNDITGMAENDLRETFEGLTSAEAVELIEGTRKSFSLHEARTRQGLAELIWQSYLACRKLMALPADEQAKIFRQYEVEPATGTTSIYTPWIKVMFGSWVNRKIKGGGMQAKWDPNRSYEVYHHTMHELADKNVTQDGATWLLERDGALKVALDRKKRLAKAAKPALAERDAKLKKLLREYGDLKGIELPDLGDAKPEPNTFFTALIWNCPTTGYRFVAVDNRKADAAAVRIAADSELALLDRMRGELDEKQALIERKQTELVDKASEMLATGANASEDRAATVRRLIEKHGRAD